MDEFLNDIYINVYKKWILSHNQDDCKLYLVDDGEIKMETKYGIGQICFHPLSIIEFSVKNIITEEIEFYLHFQFKNMRHAVYLFNEMLDSTKHLTNHHKLKVLLSCSGGLTTSYFAQKMNEAVELLGIDIHVDAIGYNNLYKVGHDYDMILLAPQISYMCAKVSEILQNQIVVKIPSRIFAKYDVKAMLALIEEKRNEKKKILPTTQSPVKLNNIEPTGKKILCLGFVRNSHRIHIAYRLYGENNQILADNEIIKKTLYIQDYYDVIDSILAQYTNVQVIGIAMPGIIHEDRITSMMIDGLDDLYFEYFTKRYAQHFYFENDVNAVALGYHASQNQYHSLSLIFQPIISYAGVGNIVHDRLLTGKHHVSGEVQFLPLNLTKNALELHQTPEGAIESMAKTIVSIISLLDPQEIVMCCFLITDVQDLYNEVKKYLPEEYIPPIIKIDYLQEYMLAGTLLSCYQKIM